VRQKKIIGESRDMDSKGRDRKKKILGRGDRNNSKPRSISRLKVS